MTSPGDQAHITVLVVSEDKPLVESLTSALLRAGYAPHVVSTGQKPQRSLIPSLCAAVIDLSDDADSLTRFVLQHLREGCFVPCLAITAAGRPDQRVMALRRGADDVVSQPIYMPDLIARLNQLVRYVPRDVTRPTVAGDASAVFDLDHATVRCGDGVISLSAQETTILKHLLRRCDRVVSHESLCVRLGLGNNGTGRSALRQAIHRLRRKLCRGSFGVVLVAVPGVGYELRLAPQASHPGIASGASSSRGEPHEHENTAGCHR